jgi:hypothetical protein
LKLDSRLLDSVTVPRLMFLPAVTEVKLPDPLFDRMPPITLTSLPALAIRVPPGLVT